MSIPEDVLKWSEVIQRKIHEGKARIHHRWQSASSSELVAFARPQMGAMPSPLRPILEPIIAVSSLLALMMLSGIGLASVTVLLAVSALIFAIMTQVFGIEIDIDPAHFGL